jgi:hypothetical protein
MAVEIENIYGSYKEERNKESKTVASGRYQQHRSPQK